MRRRSLKTLAVCLLLFAALCFGVRLPSLVLSAWAGTDHAGGRAPKLVLPSLQRDLGTVRQGDVLRTTFRVTNAGGQRLVLHEQGRPCCGQSDESRRIIVPPGRWTLLHVEIDTAQWFGQMEHTARYTTNDPQLTQLALKVTALVESPPGG
ncbi:MAG: DUF1573 domain-containing protein [Planctomycetes bacterium]|nr:DUF1573 domain-containing protein [Planctomycetota bacterium]